MSLHPSLSIFHTNQGLMSLRVQHSDLYSRPWQLLACVLVWGRHGWEKHIDHTSVYPPASLKKQTVLACLFLFCTCRNRSSKELAHLSSIPFTPLVWDPVSNSREGWGSTQVFLKSEHSTALITCMLDHVDTSHNLLLSLFFPCMLFSLCTLVYLLILSSAVSSLLLNMPEEFFIWYIAYFRLKNLLFIYLFR